MHWYGLRREAALYNFNYQIPTNKQQLVYDFYMMSFLYKKPEQYKNQNLGLLVQEIKDKLNTEFRKELLNNVFFCCVCELRHFFGGYHANSERDIRGTEYQPILETFKDQYTDRKVQYGDGPTASGIKAKTGTKVNYDRAYESALATIEQLKSTPRKFMEFAKVCFESPGWAQAYGGRAWAEIAESYLLLADATGPKAVPYMDHIIDLEHNTGTMFNKLQSWNSHSWGSLSGYDWIKRTLDYKAKIASPYELLPLCSPPMITLASRALKDTEGTAQEQGLEPSIQYWSNLLEASPTSIDLIPEMILRMIPGWINKTVNMIDANVHMLISMSDEIKNKLPKDRIATILRKHMKRRALSYDSSDLYLEIKRFLGDEGMKEAILTAALKGGLGNLTHYMLDDIESRPDLLVEVFDQVKNRFLSGTAPKTNALTDMPISMMKLLPPDKRMELIQLMAATDSYRFANLLRDDIITVEEISQLSPELRLKAAKERSGGAYVRAEEIRKILSGIDDNLTYPVWLNYLQHNTYNLRGIPLKIMKRYVADSYLIGFSSPAVAMEQWARDNPSQGRQLFGPPRSFETIIQLFKSIAPLPPALPIMVEKLRQLSTLMSQIKYAREYQFSDNLVAEDLFQASLKLTNLNDPTYFQAYDSLANALAQFCNSVAKYHGAVGEQFAGMFKWFVQEKLSEMVEEWQESRHQYGDISKTGPFNFLNRLQSKLKKGGEMQKPQTFQQPMADGTKLLGPQQTQVPSPQVAQPPQKSQQDDIPISPASFMSGAL